MFRQIYMFILNEIMKDSAICGELATTSFRTNDYASIDIKNGDEVYKITMLYEKAKKDE